MGRHPRVRRGSALGALGFRRARLVVGVIFVGVLAWVAVLLLNAHHAKTMVVEKTAPASPALVPVEPERQTGCSGDFKMDWPHGPFRKLAAAEGCLQPDGSTVVSASRFELSDEAGLPLVVSADSGVVPVGDDTPVHLSGNVRASREDFWASVDQVDLIRATSHFVSDSGVKFGNGDMTGTAGAIDHDWQCHVTILTKDPVVTVSGARAKGRQVTVHGTRIVFEEDAHVVRVREGGRIDFEGGAVLGTSLDIRLDAENKDVERVDSEGAAETITVGAVASAGATGTMERHLRADRIAHLFAPHTRILEVAAAGGATLAGAPAPGSLGDPARRESMSGDTIRLGFDGAEDAHLRRVDVAGAPGRVASMDARGQRQWSATTLEAELGPEGGLTASHAVGHATADSQEGPVVRHLDADDVRATFTGGPKSRVEHVVFAGAPAHVSSQQPAPPPRPGEAAAAPAGPEVRSLVAKKGDVTFGPDGKPSVGLVEGSVHGSSPAGDAEGDSLEMEEKTGKLHLKGSARVSDDNRDVHGDEAWYDPGPRTVLVSGRQHTIVKDASRLGVPGGLASGTEPTYISADQVLVHLDARRALYTGGRPTLRRGDNEVMADSLEIQDPLPAPGEIPGATSTLDAEGKVESRLRMTSPDPDAPPTDDTPALFDPKRLVHGKSDALRWRAAAHLIRYEGAVELRQEASHLKAKRVDVGLQEQNHDVQRVDALGACAFDSDKGAAEGDEIHYHADSHLVDVVGQRRPARARTADGQLGTGAVVEMDLKSGAIRQQGPDGSRARGSAPIVGGEGDAAASGSAPTTPGEVASPAHPAAPRKAPHAKPAAGASGPAGPPSAAHASTTTPAPGAAPQAGPVAATP